MLKRFFAVIICFALLLSFTGCSSGISPTEAKNLVQNNLDSVYLGHHDTTYMTEIGKTYAQLDEEYIGGIEVEAETFAYYTDITNLSEEGKKELVEIYKEIYSHSSYTVGEAERTDENTYSIDVVVYPIDVIERLLENYEDYLDEFYNKYAETDFEAMSPAEEEEFERDWEKAIIKAFRAQLSDIGYNAPETVNIEVKYYEDEQCWMISDETFMKFDEVVICYP